MKWSMRGVTCNSEGAYLADFFFGGGGGKKAHIFKRVRKDASEKTCLHANVFTIERCRNGEWILRLWAEECYCGIAGNNAITQA